MTGYDKHVSADVPETKSSISPPPGAITPPRIGPVELTLPDGWWLMRGEDANELPDGWESELVLNAATPDWVPAERDYWVERVLVVARRRPVTVTVDAQPGDRVVVLDLDTLGWLETIAHLCVRSALATEEAALDSLARIASPERFRAVSKAFNRCEVAE